MNNRLYAIAVLSLFGVTDAIYGVTQHYGPTGTAKCNWGGKISCDIVNRSTFSEIGGIPVAIIGLLGYLALFGAAVWALRSAANNAFTTLLALACAGLLFSFYLTFIEVWVLSAYCPICIVSQVLILGITILAFLSYRKRTKSAV